MRIEKRPTDLTDQVVDGFDLVLCASAVFVNHGGGMESGGGEARQGRGFDGPGEETMGDGGGRAIL